MTKCSIKFETILEKINGMYFCVDSMAGTILIADHKRPNVFEFSCGLKKSFRACQKCEQWKIVSN